MIVERASEIYADLYRRGCLIGDADILIAATAMENGLVLGTNNRKHFHDIPGLFLDEPARGRRLQGLKRFPFLAVSRPFLSKNRDQEKNVLGIGLEIA